MIARWIRETILEMEKAQKNQNYFRILEMQYLMRSLREMRDKLSKLKR